jgi:outer membrane protein, heavy metal efflux system
VKGRLFIFGILLLAGCVRFHPQPLSPAQSAAALEDRSLTNATLVAFIEKNLARENAAASPLVWNADTLTLAAFYYHPDLAVARAQWNGARAGIKTAGARPNPTLSVSPTYNTTTAVPSPWIATINLDVPIETAGKRGHRIEAAEHLSEAARLNVASEAWRVRSELRASLIDFAAAQRREALLQQQVSLQEQVVHQLEQQVQAGAAAGSESIALRIALQKLRLDFTDARSQRAGARVRLAGAIGVSASALDAIEIPADALDGFVPPGDLTSASARRQALQSRTDILGALADYAATEAALQTEIAKQYPDVHLNPGYEYDQGDNKWSLGITVDLPVFNQNRGPIAEAEAHREEAAAKFNALQAKVLGEIESAVEGFRVSAENSAALEALAQSQARQRDSAEAQFNAGAIGRFEFLNAQLEFAASQLVQLDGRVKLRQAAAKLEEVVQRPFDAQPALEPGRTAQMEKP